MGMTSIWHWLIVLAVVLLLFGGGGKIPKLMRDLGQGVNAFKKGLKTEKGDAAETAEGQKIESTTAAQPADSAAPAPGATTRVEPDQAKT